MAPFYEKKEINLEIICKIGPFLDTFVFSTENMFVVKIFSMTGFERWTAVFVSDYSANLAHNHCSIPRNNDLSIPSYLTTVKYNCGSVFISTTHY